jgi:hypothetical protein
LFFLFQDIWNANPNDKQEPKEEKERKKNATIKKKKDGAVSFISTTFHLSTPLDRHIVSHSMTQFLHPALAIAN